MKKIIKKLVEQLLKDTLEEINAISAGGASLQSTGKVSGTGGNPLGRDMSDQHEIMWSGDEPEEENQFNEARKFSFKKGKGLKFTRYGGLSFVKQKNERAPANKGLWAFIYPHFDWWYLSGHFSQIHGRFPKVSGGPYQPKINKNLLKHFYYSGPILTRLKVPGSVELSGWHLTDTDALAAYLPRQFANDLKDVRRGTKRWTKNYKPSNVEINKVHKELSVDHYEVFIPAKGAKYRSEEDYLKLAKKYRKPMEPLEDDDFDRELEEINAIGSGAVTGYTLPLGMKSHGTAGTKNKKRKPKNWYNINKESRELPEQIETYGDYNWGLHPELGPKFWQYTHDVSEKLYYLPKPFSGEAYEKHGKEIKEKGGWLPSRRGRSLLIAYPSKQKIWIATNPRDPRIAYALSTSYKHIPELGSYEVYMDKNYSSKPISIGILKDLITKIKIVSGKSPRWTPYQNDDDEVEYEEFKFEVLEDVEDVTWFHATKLENLKSIMSKGLLPSGEFEQGKGWTQFNLHLQDAVYLTSSEEYAEAIAETLLARTGKPAIVLAISGEALKEKEKLVVDEDRLRHEYDDMLAGGQLIPGMPDYLSSVVDYKLESLGYKGKISPVYISKKMVIDVERDEQGNVVDDEVWFYTWDEWQKEQEYINSTENKKELSEGNYWEDDDDDWDNNPEDDPDSIPVPFTVFDEQKTGVDVDDFLIFGFEPKFKEKKFIMIDLDDPNLYATQKFINKKTIENQNLGKWKGSSDLPIVIIFDNGMKFIQDGHHRLSAQKLSGEKKAKVQGIFRDDSKEFFENMNEEFIGKRGGVSYFQIGSTLPDHLYNKTDKGKPTRDPGIGSFKKNKK